MKYDLECDFDWGKYPPQAREAWRKYARTGNTAELMQVIADQLQQAGDPRRIWLAYVWILETTQT